MSESFNFLSRNDQQPLLSDRVQSALTTLIDRLDSTFLAQSELVQWGCPVPSFGDLSRATVATVGINPSNREFMDELGNELEGPARRFHTLNSLGLDSWEEVDARHMRLILDTCRLYFECSPYDSWFKKLDLIISGTKASYYDESNRACHLDLFPYATACKWTDLTPQTRVQMLAATSDTLGSLLRDSPLRLLILNGSSVVRQFEELSGASLERQSMPSWSLPRQSPRDVVGVAYWGRIDSFAGISLDREVSVLGFNHNIQSSYGVTTRVIHEIRDWIAEVAQESMQ